MKQSEFQSIQGKDGVTVRPWLRAPHYKIHFEKSATILQQPEKNKRA